MINNLISSKLKTLPAGHFDPIISIYLPLKNKQHAMISSIYSPALKADPVDKDKFYSKLCRLHQGIPIEDKVIILEDFNAKRSPQKT